MQQPSQQECQINTELHLKVSMLTQQAAPQEWQIKLSSSPMKVNSQNQKKKVVVSNMLYN